MGGDRVIISSLLTFPSLWRDIHSPNTVGLENVVPCLVGEFGGGKWICLSFFSAIRQHLFLSASLGAKFHKDSLPFGKGCAGSALPVPGESNLGQYWKFM